MGRPKGSKNKSTRAFQLRGDKLKMQLMEQALTGDMDAAKLILPFLPRPKTYTELGTIDHRLIEARISELIEFEQRLAELEKLSKNK